MSLYSSEIEIYVPFCDLDPMNVVWHGNYIKYMEQARCKMFEELNYTYIDMKNDNYAYPVVKLDVKYIKPAIFNQKLIIKIYLEEIQPALIIKYDIFDKNSLEKIFCGKTIQMGVDIKTRETLYTPPQRLIEILESSNDK